jgi:general secretion pathway protein M
MKLAGSSFSLDSISLDAIAALPPRERRMLIIGGVALLGIIIFSILLPLNRSVAHARARLEQKRADLAWMQTVAVPVLSGAPQTGTSNESLLLTVDRTTREAGLEKTVRGSEPGANGALSLRLEKAPFDALVAWLARLAQQNGVTIDSATIEKTADPGLVNVTLVLHPGVM